MYFCSGLSRAFLLQNAARSVCTGRAAFRFDLLFIPAIGAGLAAVAALMYIAQYPKVYTTMGATLGIYAFVAAVLGGLLAILLFTVLPTFLVGGVNRLLGGILGAAEAFLLCYLIGMAVTVLITFSENGWSWLNTAVVQKSTLLNWFVQFEFPV